MVSDICGGRMIDPCLVSKLFVCRAVRYSILALDDKADVTEYLVDDQTDRSLDPPTERNFHRTSTFAV